MAEQNRVIWFDRLRMSDIEQVGGKNASLGEMIAQLGGEGVRVPGGFATTASAFREFLAETGLSERIAAALDMLEVMCAGAAAMQQVFAFFRLEGMLTRIAPSAVASYGPRRVLYPQLGSMRDDVAAFGTDQALFLDRCLADEIVSFAEKVALKQLGGNC